MCLLSTGDACSSTDYQLYSGLTGVTALRIWVALSLFFSVAMMVSSLALVVGKSRIFRTLSHAVQFPFLSSVRSWRFFGHNKTTRNPDRFFNCILIFSTIVTIIIIVSIKIFIGFDIALLGRLRITWKLKDIDLRLENTCRVENRLEKVATLNS